MRSYGQYCGLAKALDVVGDRWSMLIVRELFLRDACRYTDLQHGLPGIATNLLADRLRQLERAGVIEREDAPPPVATTLFRLTERGRELRPALSALGRWGAPLLAGAPGGDEFRSHWMALPLELALADHEPDGPPVTLEVQTGDQPMLVEASGGEVQVRPGTADAPDGVLSGPPRPLVGVLMRRLTLDEAHGEGVEYEGDAGVLERLLPRPGDAAQPASSRTRGATSSPSRRT
jgi:DNA-binding HxlR family transcriptional regulator